MDFYGFHLGFHFVHNGFASVFDFRRFGLHTIWNFAVLILAGLGQLTKWELLQMGASGLYYLQSSFLLASTCEQWIFESSNFRRLGLHTVLNFAVLILAGIGLMQDGILHSSLLLAMAGKIYNPLSANIGRRA